MTHPYIDCARRLSARGVRPDDIKEIICEIGEGTVHRLWEPLAGKQQPPNGYAGKFSQPYCIATGIRARQCRSRGVHRSRRARTDRARTGR